MPIALQFVVWLVLAALSGKVASGRGRSVVLWSLLGLLFGLLHRGDLAVPGSSNQVTRRCCPRCVRTPELQAPLRPRMRRRLAGVTGSRGTRGLLGRSRGSCPRSGRHQQRCVPLGRQRAMLRCVPAFLHHRGIALDRRTSPLNAPQGPSSLS
jgi:hypothetical protein